MATNNPRGFQAARHLNGNTGTFRSHKYKVSANNGSAIFVGDPVGINAGGGIESWLTLDASAIGAKRGLLGVVRNVLDSNGRPLTHSQPTKGHFLDASTEGYVEVIDDPDVVYVVNASATATRDLVGQLVPVAFGTYNSAAGISGAGIDLANAVVTGTGNEPFQVMGIAGNELEWPDEYLGSAANTDMEVRISDHLWRRAFTIVGQDTD